jgi:hypothetical protein
MPTHYNKPESYGPKRGRFSVPETVGLPDYDPTDPYGIASEGGAEYDDFGSLMRGMTGNITNADRRRMIENAQGRGQQIAGGLDQYSDLLMSGEFLGGVPRDQSEGIYAPNEAARREGMPPSVIAPGPKPPYQADEEFLPPPPSPPQKPTAAPGSFYSRNIDPTVQAVGGAVSDVVENPLPTGEGTVDLLNPVGGPNIRDVERLVGSVGKNIAPTARAVSDTVSDIGIPTWEGMRKFLTPGGQSNNALIQAILRSAGLLRAGESRDVAENRGTDQVPGF